MLPQKLSDTPTFYNPRPLSQAPPTINAIAEYAVSSRHTNLSCVVFDYNVGLSADTSDHGGLVGPNKASVNL